MRAVSLALSVLSLAAGLALGACFAGCGEADSYFLEDGTYTGSEEGLFRWISLTLEGDLAQIEYEREDGARFRVTYQRSDEVPAP